jgi:hypothetical protein
MMKSRVQRAVTACSCIVVSAAAAGCGGTASGAEQTVKAARAQDSTVIAAQPEPLTLVVQMTGLLLLVPPTQPTANTLVLMPDAVANHEAVIGFKTATDPGYCDVRYDNARHICYVKMNGWSLTAVGAQPSAGGLPKGAANLTRFAGKKVNIPDATSRSRAEIALPPGIVTDTCSLASWTFNPVGNEGPERLSFINVMEWIAPIAPANPLNLTRTNKTTGLPQTLGPLEVGDQNEVELLVMYLPEAELNQIIYGRASPGAPARDESADVPLYVGEEMRVHFNAFYRTVGVQENAPKPVPQRPRRSRSVCPITILGLETARAQEPGGPRGTKTLSCVMTSAEQS